jgi:hypothetical protein
MVVLWSFVYLALRRVLGLLVLRGKTEQSKDLELVVLRHELGILRRPVLHHAPTPPRLGTHQPRSTSTSSTDYARA